jgi:hypothetical protein
MTHDPNHPSLWSLAPGPFFIVFGLPHVSGLRWANYHWSRLEPYLVLELKQQHDGWCDDWGVTAFGVYWTLLILADVSIHVHTTVISMDYGWCGTWWYGDRCCCANLHAGGYSSVAVIGNTQLWNYFLVEIHSHLDLLPSASIFV